VRTHGWIVTMKGLTRQFSLASDPQGCEVLHREQLRPIRPLREVVKEILLSDGEFVPTQSSPVFPFTTEEGEHGCGVVTDGQRAQQPERRIFCAVFAEDFFVLLDATLRLPERFDEYGQKVAELAASTLLGLGERPRRYVLQAPLGWRSVANGLVARLYPPDYPTTKACLTVSPAEPITEPVSPSELARRLGDADGAHELQPEPATSESAKSLEVDWDPHPYLSFSILQRRLRTDGWERVARLAAYLQDDRALYPLRLDVVLPAATSELEGIFLGVVQSVVPLPRATSSALASGLASASLLLPYCD
jgi:hypothetical protein